MFDLLVKGGTLPDGTVADIGINGAQIAAVGQLKAEAGRVIDAAAITAWAKSHDQNSPGLTLEDVSRESIY